MNHSAQWYTLQKLRAAQLSCWREDMKNSDPRVVELDALLVKAERAVRALPGIDWAIRFKTPSGFGDAIADARHRIQAGDKSALKVLANIFGPTCAWDDEIGAAGIDLANRACSLIDGLERDA